MEAFKGAGLLMLLALALVSPMVKANVGDFDKTGGSELRKPRRLPMTLIRQILKSPIISMSRFTRLLHRSMDGNNSTRRHLRRKRTGKCLAPNPIDRCWRCDKNWARNRKKLADCVQGFGPDTTGGKAGPYYVVSNPADDDLVNPKPGTLRHAVIQDGPLWITFAHDMITLSEELLITDDKTIDARGANVHIFNGAQITLQFVKNIIIHGLYIHQTKAGNGGMIRDSVNHYGFRTRSNGYGISMYGASRICLDHISMSHRQDGLIYAVIGSNAITISNCHFTHHNEVMLFGASDSYSQDQLMQITVAFNQFGKGLVQRMLRCRWGFVHVVNNDYTHWLMYAIGGSKRRTILSQGNRFIAPPNPRRKEITKRKYSPGSVWRSWSWRSEKDLRMNGAYFVQSGSPILKVNRKDVMSTMPGTYVTRLTRFAGALNCFVNKPC